MTAYLPPDDTRRGRVFGSYPPIVYVLRAIHVALGSFFTVCLVYLYYVAFSVAQITSTAWGAAGALVGETVVFLAAGGVCPVSSWQRRYGDEKGLLGLFLPVRLARSVFPIVLAIGAVPIALILWRAFR